MEALKRLSAEDREILLLTSWEGLDPTENRGPWSRSDRQPPAPGCTAPRNGFAAS